MSICLKITLFLFPLVLLATDAGHVDIVNGRVTITAGRVAIGPQDWYSPYLFSRYHLDGDANDSASTNNGTISGATSTSGVYKTAYYFDGNDIIDLTRQIGFYPKITNSTVAFWLNVAQAKTNTQMAVMGTISDGSKQIMQLFVNSSNSAVLLPNSIYMRITDDTPKTVATLWVYPDLCNGQWRHIAVTFVAATKVMTAFVDGIPIVPLTTITSEALVSCIDMQYPFYLAARNVRGTAGNYFTGGIDEVMFLTRALSSNDVNRIKNNLPPIGD